MAVPDSLSYTPRSGQQQSDDGAFPSDGAKSKSNILLVIDNLDFFLEGRFASLSPMQVSLEIDVLLLTVEMPTFASLVHSGSLRPYPLDVPSAPGQRASDPAAR